MNIYDLKPQIMLESFVAPNCTVVGEVEIGMES
jgi:carbonic anhydrase/acetyltransferase-like protein (isoleucine patch superfamily)